MSEAETDFRLISGIRNPTPSAVQSRAVQRRLEAWAYRTALVLSDTGALALAFALSYWLRFGLLIAIHPEVVPPSSLYARISFFAIPVWIAVLALFGAYDHSALFRGTDEYSRASNACSVGILLFVWGTFLFPEFVIARGWLVLSWIFAVLLTCSGRFLLRRAARRLRSRGCFLARTAIVGGGPEVSELFANLNDVKSTGFKLIGFITGRSEEFEPPCSLPPLGPLNQVDDLVDLHEIDALIVSTSSVDRDQLVRLFELAGASHHVDIHFSTGLFELMTAGLTVKTVGAVPLTQIKALRLTPAERLTKRVIDIGLSLILLALLTPVLLLISVLVKLDSQGPVFYRRRVVGVGGREFGALKFRTMRPDGDQIINGDPILLAELRTNHKIEDDPRITRFGRWLRRYSLDELPQLIAVVWGRMSLVGPRMITREELPKYGTLQRNLLSVKPGLTGLWQVSGRSDLSYQERIRLDMHYIRNYSLWRDLHILLVQTLPVVLRGRGAR